MWLLWGHVSAVTSVGKIVHVLHVREIVTFFILGMHSSDRLNAFYFAAQPIVVQYYYNINIMALIQKVLLHIDQSSIALTPSQIES